MNYPNTPGVKISEVSLLPPSIVQVSTAIPIFLGYTESGTIGEAVRLTSLKEYIDIFGGAKKHTFSVDASFNVTAPTTLDYLFYENIKMYFLNGGGACYILPVGHYSDAITKTAFVDGIALVDKLDEPTLIVFPEAVTLTNLVDYGSVAAAAQNLCFNTKEKFALIDSPNGADLVGIGNVTDTYRDSLSGAASYGAAYYPHLQVNLNYSIDETASTFDGVVLDTITSNANYEIALSAINKSVNVILPPSALMAGVYAKIDRDFGVWKAPANIPLQGVVKPMVAISDEMQENLNVDATSGKSINAIRQFTGKGSVVWGARTLDGNSNEWRYIQVRRLFITVEESVKKATSQFVFENNDSKTWVKVSSMIRSYLNGLWKEGALTGATPDEAFFVQVGVGTTMTEQDVLEGKMIVQIGLAAVRPAEFIILEFSHFVNQ